MLGKLNSPKNEQQKVLRSSPIQSYYLKKKENKENYIPTDNESGPEKQS